MLRKEVIEEMRERNDSLIKDAIERQVIDSLQKKIDLCTLANDGKLDEQKIKCLLDGIDSIKSTNGRQVTRQEINDLLQKYPTNCKTAIINKADAFFKKDEVWRKFNAEFLDFGLYPGQKEITKDCNEMTYYIDSIYEKAWFDDNLGSFLIVVEHKKDKP